LFVVLPEHYRFWLVIGAIPPLLPVKNWSAKVGVTRGDFQKKSALFFIVRL